MSAPRETLIDGESLQRFIESIPTADAIRARIARNTDETAVLKRLLRLAITAEKARATEGELVGT